jgi:hypothetical protein
MSQATASGVKRFISYGLGPGQSVEKQLSYAPLPSDLVSKNQTQLNALMCNGSPLQ